MILGAVESVIMILILILIGYFAAFKGWVSKGTSRFITKLVLNITLPCTIVYSFLMNFTRGELLGSGKYILAALCGAIVFYLAGVCVARLARIPKGRRGVFTALFSFSNSAFVGFPVALAIFGEKGMVYAVFYFLANTTSFNTLGYMEISRDGAYLRGQSAVAGMAKLSDADAVVLESLGEDVDAAAPAPSTRQTSGESIFARVMQPPVVAVFVAIALVLLGVRLPDFANTTLSYVSGITSPLSLMFVGTILHKVGIRSLRLEKELSLVMLGRFVGAPLVMLGICLLFGIEGFPQHVFITQMALPVMVSSVIYSEACGADSGLATRGMVMSTLLSFIVLPILVILFGG